VVEVAVGVECDMALVREVVVVVVVVLLVAVGVVWQMVPLCFLGAQARPNGLCAATGI
jgi:hypothetical protein